MTQRGAARKRKNGPDNRPWDLEALRLAMAMDHFRYRNPDGVIPATTKAVWRAGAKVGEDKDPWE